MLVGCASVTSLRMFPLSRLPTKFDPEQRVVTLSLNIPLDTCVNGQCAHKVLPIMGISVIGDGAKKGVFQGRACISCNKRILTVLFICSKNHQSKSETRYNNIRLKHVVVNISNFTGNLIH